MSFFRRKVKGKDEKPTDLKVVQAAVPVHSPTRSTKNHALLEAAGPSHVAINAISANMDSYSSSRTAALKKQPSHMEAAHFGDLALLTPSACTRARLHPYNDDIDAPLPPTPVEGAQKNLLSDWNKRVTWFIMRILGTLYYPPEPALPKGLQRQDGQLKALRCHLAKSMSQLQNVIILCISSQQMSSNLTSDVPFFCCRSCLNYQTQEAKSKLSKTLEQVLLDNVALPYFIQFMELRRMEHLVRFWLEAESFRSTTWSRIRAHSLNTVKQSTLAEPVSPSLQRHDPEDSGQTSHVEKGTGGSNTAQPLFIRSKEMDLMDRLKNAQNRSGQPCDNSLSINLGKTLPASGELEEASRLTASTKNSPTSALKDLSGKLMKSIEKDAITTFTKYISPDAAKPIPITETMRIEIVAKICGEDGQVDPNCFLTAQSIVFNAMDQEHFMEFLRSHHFCKYQIEVLTSGIVYLADILFCESALFYFSEYMEKEDAVNILQFWLAADNFQSQLAIKKGQYDGQEAQNDAMILYDRYFSLQATHPLGFDDVVRLEIESNICREGGPLPNCFTTPLRQAWTTMEKVYLPGFLSSNLYYKYLNDLIHSVRGDEYGWAGLPGQVSNCALDHESGGSETACNQSSVKKANVKILKNFDEAIIVDAASLDPESLYQRTYAGKMSFGKVSDLGQFIRESEPEPDIKKSKGSMLSQAMKKWVQGEKDEAQEEMAWKIAKMIINEVMQQAQLDQQFEKSTKL